MSTSADIATAPPVLTSHDMLAGLGAAPRDLLAACLALFDDSTLQARLRGLWDKWKPGTDNNAARDAEAVAEAMQGTLRMWRDSALTDDDLRLLLWIRLRDAFELPAKCFASPRMAATAADDLVARTLGSLQPGRVAGWLEARGWKETRDRPATLDALARMTLQEMLEAVLTANDAQSAAVRERVLEEVRDSLNELDPEARRKLLDSVGADELNDAAIRKIMLTGGGLAAFGTGVSMAGFSAYILAAQVSAFIPFVSGPALVTLVSVLSNPITVVVGTVGMAWWATTSANADIRMAISARVISMLTLSGTLAGDAGVRSMIASFPRLESLRSPIGPGGDAVARYVADWKVVAPVHAAAGNPDLRVLGWMERQVPDGEASRLGDVVAGRVDEYRNAAALGVMTLGDILYNAWRIDPHVIEAADFSRVQDLGDPVAFAGFAHEISAMTDSAALGAVSNLKGYVGERVVAEQLAAKGHVVDFPDNANETGWDIAVDGVRYQVKNVQRLSDLQEHFDRGSGYPVIANSEIAEQIAAKGDNAPDWADQVHFIEGYSSELVDHVTRQSLDAGDAMLHPDVPVFAVLLSGVRNYQRNRRGEISGSQAVQEILVDGGTRAGLAVAGGYVGTGVGLLVFGPAGALVLGSVTPILSQMQSGRIRNVLDSAVSSRVYNDWRQRAEQALLDLIAALESILRRKEALMCERRPSAAAGVASTYLGWRADQDVAWLQEAGCRLRAIRDATDVVERRVERVMQWLSVGAVFPSQCKVELAALSDVFRTRPTLGERAAERTLDAVEATVKAADQGIGVAKDAAKKLMTGFDRWLNSSKDRR